MKKKLDIHGHVLLLKHTKLNEKDSEKLLKDYNIIKKQLPNIFKSDPAIAGLDDINPGDVIEITRQSPTNKTSKYYRVVINA